MLRQVLTSTVFPLWRAIPSCPFSFSLQNTSTPSFWSFFWSLWPTRLTLGAIMDLYALPYRCTCHSGGIANASLFLEVHSPGPNLLEHRQHASASSGSSASCSVLNKQSMVIWSCTSVCQLCWFAFTSSFWRWRQPSPQSKPPLPLGYIRPRLRNKLLFPWMCIF